MTCNVKLIWTTKDAEKLIAYMARVSSNNQDSEDLKLLNYLVKHKHWSPFEMCNMCVEIVTSRAISAQILRHKSFNFQEFSQRYAENTEIVTYPPRRQDVKNRQNSIDDITEDAKQWWLDEQRYAQENAIALYKEALSKGIAKECARMVLPMATQTKLYMSGTLRSWIHYLQLRCAEDTQLEHRDVASKIKEIFQQEFPTIGKLLNKEE